MNFTLKKSDLNFKVYTVPSKPTTPGAENDIAIISSVPMTNWIMSPEKPSGIPRNDGDVWIQYSTSGNAFNALKQNALMIATISAWQYVDGAWVDRDAVSCQGGEWVDWVTDLFLLSSEGTHNDVTGGWYVPPTYDLTKQANGTYLLKRNSQYSEVYTNDEINVSEYKTLTIKVKSSSGANNVSFWVKDSDTAFAGTTSSGEEEINLDISRIDGKYKVYMSPTGAGYYAYIESIKLVK